MDFDYTSLMTRRIRRILLVCNNYDSYSLEEDGRIEAQITHEYSELNLSNPPSIVRAESTADALEIAGRGESFDLIITMYNVGEINVFEFSDRMKEMSPETPIVLLTSFSREIARQIDSQEKKNIDYVFCWNNSTDLIIAIIKLLEDKLNADHDISDLGVQAILLVEDSVRYYSTYLPALYKMVLQQNSESIRDALNEKQQISRKRSRPKILMATNFDDAVSLYRKYRSNYIGIISDIGFTKHHGESSDKEQKDAGLEFCRMVREDNPKMPFLLQSMQESMREEAERLDVGFFLKNSKTLIHDISQYIGQEFGFGDLIVRDPETKEEIARATDLYTLEKLVKKIPTDALSDILERNYLSKWMLARGLFALGNKIRPRSAKDFSNDEAHRKFLVDSIHDYRINQAIGVVARFDPQSFNDAIWFSRFGSGSIGGKARGLAFLNHILVKHNFYDKWEGVRVLVPRTLVITTEYFDRFIIDNGLQYVINSDISDQEILSEFVASTLPTELTDALKVFLRHIRKPLAIRSSSKLEDSYYQPFAGVYSTYMIPDTDNLDQRLRLISKAIKSVYASVYYASSRSYITATGNVISEEKMAIVIQEVCGSEDKGYFFPTLSGVARSVNYYSVGYEQPEDGIAKVAFGLGKAVVDGDQVLRFCPRYPDNVLQTSTPELIMKETQRAMFALNLKPEKFKTSIDDAVNLERLDINDCTGFRNIRYVASTWDFNGMRIVDSPDAEGPKFITFSHILKYRTFPLADIVKQLLEISFQETKCCVEIEFAANLDRGKKNKVFNVLQIRPMAANARDVAVDWKSVDCSDAILESTNALGTGWIGGVTDIVYLRPQNFDILKTVEIRDMVKEINDRMREEGRSYVLIGFGRWGSSIPSLGVPVQWSDISEAKVIVECGLERFRIDPSQGSHFFQNLTSFGVGYINVNPYAGEGNLDFDRLDSMPAVTENEYVRQVRFEAQLQICIDGLHDRALIK